MKRNFTLVTLGLALLLAAPAPRLRAADALPKADTILDKYVEVTGGKAAYEKVHNMVTTGSMAFTAMGIKGTMTGYHAEPNKAYSEIEIPGIGKITQGSDGTVAWTMSAMQGPHVMEGEEKAQAMRENAFKGEVEWRKLYKSAETTGTDTVDGKECYKVVLTPDVGAPTTRCFDKQSGFMVKVAMTAKTPMGDIPVESTMSDYRKEGEIVVPHKTTMKQAGQEFSITIDTVKWNVDMPANRFDLPPEIQALVKK